MRRVATGMSAGVLALVTIGAPASAGSSGAFLNVAYSSVDTSTCTFTVTVTWTPVGGQSQLTATLVDASSLGQTQPQTLPVAHGVSSAVFVFQATPVAVTLPGDFFRVDAQLDGHKAGSAKVFGSSPTVAYPGCAL